MSRPAIMINVQRKSHCILALSLGRSAQCLGLPTQYKVSVWVDAAALVVVAVADLPSEAVARRSRLTVVYSEEYMCGSKADRVVGFAKGREVIRQIKQGDQR